MKNAHYIFLRAQSDVFRLFLCPANSLKSKDCSFTIINNKEKQQIFTFRELKFRVFGLFGLKNTLNN